MSAVRQADVAILVLGISATLEGEEMSVSAEGFLGGDRTDISLPKGQEALLKVVHAGLIPNTSAGGRYGLSYLQKTFFVILGIQVDALLNPAKE